MSRRFLKLTNIIINSNHIKQISIKPEKFCIDLEPQLSGWILCGSGGFSADKNILEIEKDLHSTDYKIVKDWIDKL
jgi:hypothetical protein